MGVFPNENAAARQSPETQQQGKWSSPTPGIAARNPEAGLLRRRQRIAQLGKLLHQQRDFDAGTGWAFGLGRHGSLTNIRPPERWSSGGRRLS
jgi:hypothetical protein